MSGKLRDVQPGEPLSARAENELRQTVREQSQIRVGAGLFARQGAGGFMLEATCPERIWIQITSSYTAPGYAWSRVERSGGVWVTTGETGTVALDPAVEQNADTSITSGSRRYPAERDLTSGELIFLKV